MTSRVTHQQASENIDTANPELVGSGSWNDDHIIVFSAVLDALDKMGLTGTQILYCTSAGVFQKDITAYMLALLGQSDQNGLLSFIHAQLQNDNLTAESGLTGTADKISYYTGPGTKDLTALSAFVRTVLGAASSAAFCTDAGAVNKAGDTMSGNLAMATNKVTGVGAPSATTDAANKAYVDALATLVSGALVFKGAWDASAGTFPGAAVAQTGWFYKVSVAGTVNSILFDVGDDIFAIVNNASTSTYASNWLRIEGAVTLAEMQTAAGFNFGSLAALSAVTVSLISDASANGRSLVSASNYAAMKTLLGIAVADITDASANGRSLVSASNYAAMKTLLGIAVADITDASANGRSLISAANYAAMKTLLAMTVADVSGAAPLASPALSGNPTTPTQTPGDNSTKIASTAYVAAATAGAGVTSLNGQGGVLAFVAPPQGRLTLSSGVPVMISSVPGATNVYYTPYVGNQVPIYDGTNLVPFSVAEISQATTDTTKSPAAVAGNSVYDIFVWNDSGAIRATRGPAWTSDLLRSAGTALVRVNGIWLNNATITNGPAAQRGTYVGTIRSNASSTIDFIFGAAASGGTAGFFGVWNAYNRVENGTIVKDSGTSYGYSSSTARAARGGSGMAISFVTGLQEDAVQASFTSSLLTAAVTSSFGGMGLALDSTSSFAQTPFYQMPQSAVPIAGRGSQSFQFAPQFGVHSVSINETSDGTNTVTFNVDSGNTLSMRLRM
jgi:hypothetical protein